MAEKAGLRVIPIQGHTPEELAEKLGLPTPELRRLVSHVRRGGSLDGPLAQVRRVTLEAVRAACAVPTLAVLAEERSALDPFRKLVLGLADGERIETVRIPLERTGRFSACDLRPSTLPWTR